jgi:hypothetical protein
LPGRNAITDIINLLKSPLRSGCHNIL